MDIEEEQEEEENHEQENKEEEIEEKPRPIGLASSRLASPRRPNSTGSTDSSSQISAEKEAAAAMTLLSAEKAVAAAHLRSRHLLGSSAASSSFSSSSCTTTSSSSSYSYPLNDLVTAAAWLPRLMPPASRLLGGMGLGMVPSIDTLCFNPTSRHHHAIHANNEPEDLRIKRRRIPSPPPASEVTSGQRVSTIRKNPLYPVTLPLIQRLVAEDQAQFGRLPPPIPRCPDLLYLTAGAAVSPPSTPLIPVCSPPPLSPSRLVAATLSSSLAAMANSSLPPRKRRLLQASAAGATSSDDEGSSQRGSVIQFGIRV
jgi:hypothetical protein